MQNLLSDLCFGLRTLRKAPGFTAAAVLTIALGISVNTTMFSVVNTVLLQPLPYADSSRLMTVYEVEPELAKAPVTMPDLIDWRQRNRSFEAISSMQPRYAALTGRDRPERIAMLAVTGDFFATLGVRPRLGRAFTVEEETKGKEHVIILGDGLFRSRFGGDASIVGSTIRMDGSPYTVVGVMPPGFQFLSRWPFDSDALVPMVLEPNEQMRGSHDRLAFGRLKRGVTVEQARNEMSSIAAQLEREHPVSNGKIGAKVVPFHEDLTGGLREVLVALLGAVGFVLLIACANVANLLLARGAARRQEVAIRVAMGASRGRIVRQLLTESLLLAGGGGIAGLGLAYGAVTALRHIEGLRIPRLADVSVDPAVLGFSLAMTVAAGLLAGLAPAVLLAPRDLHGELKASADRTVAGSGRAKWLRGVLVASELALAVILLIGAGLMVRSLNRLLATPLGFQPEGVFTAQIWLPEKQYGSDDKAAVFARALLERVRSIPGVTSASVANKLPLRGGQNGTMIVEGEANTGPEMEGPLVENSSVYPGYFKTLGIPLRAGRLFEEADLRKDFGGLIVNETFVRVLLKNADPIGKRISYDKNPPHWHEIIGVVADNRQQGLATPALPEAYELSVTPFMTLVAHTQLDAAGLAEPVRREMATIDPDVPLAEVRTMENILDLSSAIHRIFVRLIGTFAGIALALAAIGIYGLVAFSMSQRRHEIGIRMALGATSRDVIGMALASAARLVAAGMVVGVAGALWLTQYLKSVLYQVSPLDALTFTAVPALLAAIALAASFIPAARAASTDPARTLRDA